MSTFGMWTIVQEAKPIIYPSGATKARVVARCDCGTERVVDLGNLTTGKSKSCGCVRPARKHGLMRVGALHPLCGIWKGIIARCDNPKQRDYHNYGGRGIRVCDRWRHLELFVADVGERPSKAHELDRIDNNGNYEPGNVRWATTHEQSRNTRRNVYITIRGETKCLKDWCLTLGLSYATARWRIRQGLSPADALSHASGSPIRASNMLTARTRA